MDKNTELLMQLTALVKGLTDEIQNLKIMTASIGKDIDNLHVDISDKANKYEKDLQIINASLALMKNPSLAETNPKVAEVISQKEQSAISSVGYVSPFDNDNINANSVSSKFNSEDDNTLSAEGVFKNR